MEIAEYVDELERAGTQLARAARLVALDAAVPPCPGWTVSDLVRHTTRVHQWATSIVQGGAREEFQFDRPDDDSVLAVYDRGLTGLLAALRSAPADLEVWTFLPAESALAFWARRQAHETAIHRVDADLASGMGGSEVDPDFAADGIAELLVGLIPGRFRLSGVTGVHSITVTPVDVNRAWTISIGPDSVATVEEASDGSDLNIFGMASDLYRWVWNRAGDDEVALRGDLKLADLWHHSFKIGDKRE